MDEEQETPQAAFERLLKDFGTYGSMTHPGVFNEISNLIWGEGQRGNTGFLNLATAPLQDMYDSIHANGTSYTAGLFAGHLKEILANITRFSEELSERGGRLYDVLKKHGDWVPWGIAKHETMLGDADFLNAVHELEILGLLEEERKAHGGPLLKLINPEAASDGCSTQ